MPFVINLAKQSKMYDVPDERKTHNYLVSSLGGIGIFTGLAISLLLTSDFKSSNAEFQYYIATFFIIFIIGIIDDIFVLRPWKKVLGQLVTSAIIAVKAHLVIASLGGFLGIYQLSPAECYGLTFFVIMLVVNAFNLIDGIDGLAASLGLISCVLFALFFLINHNFSYAILGFAMAGALLAFLVYNFHPARIFMGDSGSMLIGLVNAVLLLKFINTGSTVADYPVPAAPALGFSMLVIPLMDVLRVFCIRLFQGRSPFSPDRNHVHHLLLNKGFSHGAATLLLSGITLMASIVAFFFRQLNINILFAAQIALFFMLILVFQYPVSSKKVLRVVSRRDEQPVTGKVEVYSLYTQKENAVVKED
jgi:UDP-N-acetylmuramyl pentapeptide phosphotransferase/UDP-N-acetylglucosamine-1-phosphate transferase